MSSASATIKLFDNENIINETKPTLNYFERTIQPIFDEIKTTEDLILWCVIVISICVGIILNLLVIRSILRIKCNGLYFTVEFFFMFVAFHGTQVSWSILFYFIHFFLSLVDRLLISPYFYGSTSNGAAFTSLSVASMFAFQDENPIF